MNMRFLLPLVLFPITFIAVQAQSPEEAFALYQKKDHMGSALMYDEILKDGSGKASNHYDAACSWALAGNKDKAFKHLDHAVDKGWTDLLHLRNDSDLRSLYSDPRWEQLVQRLQVILEKVEASYDKALKARLEAIFLRDQHYRGMVDSVSTHHGMDSPEWKELLDKMGEADERNKEELIPILEEYGWPSPDLVGPKANSTVFLVLQHSDQETMEKYLPMLRDAVVRGHANKGSLALMEDRVRMNRGQPQLYGSQLRMNPETNTLELYTVENEEEVDIRRAEMGLEPLKNYLARFGLEYLPPSERH